MLTRVSIRHFKRFVDVSIELGNPVVFIGPNNSGKTTALQGLALWQAGLRRWLEKREGDSAPEKRPGVAINRRDLLAIPVPTAKLLWRGTRTHEAVQVDGQTRSRPLRIEIVVEGVDEGAEWACGLEFEYANEESVYCRPLRVGEGTPTPRMPVPPAAAAVRLAFLPPMSGLASIEERVDPGAIRARIGEGRTAEVLRNLCHQLASAPDGKGAWIQVVDRIESLFGIRLNDPEYSSATGQITLSFVDRSGSTLDISASGRGLQQTLLLLSHMSVNRGAVLLLDEPDAHLEILRQRHIYQTLSDMSRNTGGQIIAASHSEIILNEAADKDTVVAFLGAPHRIDDRGSQLLKSLKEIGFDQYYQAEQTGWVLYAEGATDLAILRGLARVLGHPAGAFLERPFVHYVANQPARARNHFFGLSEAKGDLVGFALFDRLESPLQVGEARLVEVSWKKREIENYVCQPETLLSWAQAAARRHHGDLFQEHWRQVMSKTIAELETALQVLGKPSPWSADLKVTDEFLDRLFAKFFEQLGLPNLLRKTDYHVLVDVIDPGSIDPEVRTVLDAIAALAGKAKAAAAD